MGTIRFFIPSRDLDDWPEIDRAYLGDAEGHVESCEPTLSGNELLFSRASDQSTRLFVACPVAGLGRPVLGTGSLRGREEPYDLLVELARGRVSQIREMEAHWRLAEWEIPPDISREIEHAHGRLCRATCLSSDGEAIAAAGREALQAGLSASERLMTLFVRRQLLARRREKSRLPILLSCPLKGLRPGLGWEEQFRPTFTAAKVAVEWSLVEEHQGGYDWSLPDEQAAFAARNGLFAIGGPLIDFRPGGLPQWLSDWSHDYWSFQSIVSDFVETAVGRYGDRIGCWEVAAAPNMGTDAGGGEEFDEEYRLAITAKAIEVARQANDGIEISLRIAQPWGEYQRRGRDRLSPRQFAEALVRTGAGLTQITLEVAIGFQPHGSGYRDRFELGRLIDRWSSLEVPLTVALAFPSRGCHDEFADPAISVGSPQWKQPWGEEAQAEWMGEMLSLLMAKTAITGIEWSHFSDGVSHRFPHAGLTRADESGKMILERLRRLRRSCVGCRES